MNAAAARLEVSGGIARVVLDRPPLNILDLDTLEALAQALSDAAGETTAKVVTLQGSGRAFCAGVDVADHAPDRAEPMLALFHEVIRRLRALEPPVVAVVQGAALGGGCELALACDLVLARADARIGQPEINLGVFPPVAAALLPRLVGRQRALDLVLTGRVLSGHEACVMGLVARDWPADDFEAGVREFLDQLSRLSRPVLRLAKRAVAAGAHLPPNDALGLAEDIYRDELMSLADAREGIAAFLEKRAPVWRDA